MQRIRWLVFIAPFFLSLTAHACECMGRAECGAFHIQDTVFVGKVLSVRTTENNADRRHRRIFRFEITEWVAGARQASKEVDVETGMGGGDCGYGFVVGNSYLVDAGHYGENGSLSTSICEATQPEETAHDLLREIHALLTHQRLPDLSGEVYARTSLYGSPQPSKPLAGITVHLTPANGNAYTATTDAEGVYTFRDLPTASYKIHFDVPPKQITLDEARHQRDTIKIPVSGGAACHRDAMALPAGSISGQIVDSTGKPVSMFGVVTLQKPGSSHDEQVGAGQDTDGRFKIPFVPAGEYRVVYRRFAPSREAWMESNATYIQGIVRLEEGQSIDGIQIVLR